MQNQRSVLLSMLALPRGWNNSAPTTPLLPLMIPYAVDKVNIRASAAAQPFLHILVRTILQRIIKR